MFQEIKEENPRSDAMQIRLLITGRPNKRCPVLYVYKSDASSFEQYSDVLSGFTVDYYLHLLQWVQLVYDRRSSFPIVLIDFYMNLYASITKNE